MNMMISFGVFSRLGCFQSSSDHISPSPSHRSVKFVISVIYSLLWLFDSHVIIGWAQLIDKTPIDTWPHFVLEPPSRIIFYNSTGVTINCRADGKPEPSTTWLTMSTGQSMASVHGDRDMWRRVKDVPGLRHVRSDGSLEFPPFSQHQFNDDIHSAIYRCIATNPIGTISSRNVRLRGVVLQNLEARVYDQFVVKGSTGVLRCQLPTHLQDVATVISWIREDGLIIRAFSSSGNLDSKYILFPTGELHIIRVSKEDSELSYRCQISDTIHGRNALSISSGRLAVTEPQGNSPPQFVHKIRTVKVRAPDHAMLPCAAQGFPSVVIKWYKQAQSSNSPIAIKNYGKKIRILDDGTLLITYVNAQDSGTYFCHASNTYGEERSFTHLTVMVPLKSTITPSVQKLKLGSSLIINCSIIGDPIDDIRWLKNGQTITFNGSNRIKLIRKDCIAIDFIQAEDAGIYQCLVSNEEESSQSATLIKIISEAPILLKKPSNMTTHPDSRVSLRCSAKGNPLPQIIWTSHGYPVQDTVRLRIGDYVASDGSVISFINITRLSVEEGGRYECTAVNDFGKQSSTAWIHVIGSAPYIKPMRNITVVAGRMMSINCPFSIHRISSLSWAKGNRQLPLNRRQTVYPNGTLIVQNVARDEDEGEYKCLIRDKDGRTAERSAHIRVLVAPSIMPFSFTGNLQEGVRSSATCTVTTGDTPIHIRWTKDNQPLTSSSEIQIESVNEFMSALAFKPLKPEHSGHYSCIASNEASTENHTVILSVDSPPRWKIEPQSRSTIVGESLLIDCQANGKPEPRVLWKKAHDSSELASNFKTVISGSRVQTLVNGSMYFIEITDDDSGSYMCEASNGIGSPLSTVITITVHVPARFMERYQAIQSRKDDTVELTCTAIGEMPMKIIWSKDGKMINPLISRIVDEHQAIKREFLSKLIIRSESRTDSGVYMCTASNPYGTDERKIELTVHDRPDSVTELKITKMNSRTFQIHWTEPFDGNLPLKRYVLSYKEDNESWQNSKELTIESVHNEATVRGLMPRTTYHVRIRAENEMGKSEWSSIASVTTEEEVPDSPPRDVKATATGSRSVRVMWQPPSSKHHRTSITGYYIGYKKQVDGGDRLGSFIFKTVKSDLNSPHYSEDISGLEKLTKYAIVVQAYNNKSAGPLSDEVIVQTTEYDPPTAPSLKVVSVTSHSIELEWDPPSDGNPVFGYVIKYKKQDEYSWHKNEVSGDIHSHSLVGLDCGSNYHLTISGHNSMGIGKQSDMISVKTYGSVPRAPERENLFTSNLTFVLLHFSSWTDSDCLIEFFSIQYKPETGETWIKLDEGSFNSDKTLAIRNLSPATWYEVRMSARNGAGTTSAQYKVATLTENGEYLQQHGDSSTTQFMSTLVPIVCSMAIVIALFTLAFGLIYCHNKSRTISLEYNSSSGEESQPKSECLPMDDISSRKNDFMDHYGTSVGHHEETIYFPSPYASSRVGTGCMIDGGPVNGGCGGRDMRSVSSKNLAARNSLQSSNMYDIPQQRNIPAKSIVRGRIEPLYSEFWERQ
ncbi:cell adhesion molecule Dscam1-like isoform X2 [Brevipalpus obovatus]|uniref:cell adhesion molecule Dscam1-like isoform X2 n=1 Tax=Brevipalpus obovatus TaxID=246614 RepID=UPI003D9E9904